MVTIPRRSGAAGRGWAAQIRLRLIGAMLLGLCALMAWALYVSVHRVPARSPGPVEYGEAVVVVAGWALGWALVAEGPGLFREVELSARHARFR